MSFLWDCTQAYAVGRLVGRWKRRRARRYTETHVTDADRLAARLARGGTVRFR